MPLTNHPIDFLAQLHPLSEAIVERLRLTLQKENFKKKSFLLEEGQVSSRVYFIAKGLVRVYYWKDGVEICSGLLAGYVGDVEPVGIEFDIGQVYSG